jgi:uncharacterized tellurite resistance protein B-like protein
MRALFIVVFYHGNRDTAPAMYYGDFMLAKIRAFLFEQQGRADSTDGVHSHEELHLAAAALMVEAAGLDGDFDATERAKISDILRQRFELDAESASALIDAAIGAVDTIPEIYGFTRTLRQNFDHDERIAMLELLWEVAYADGELHDYEASLLRQVTGLLYVTDQESGAARKRVLARLRD